MEKFEGLEASQTAMKTESKTDKTLKSVHYENGPVRNKKSNKELRDSERRMDGGERGNDWRTQT